MDETEYILQCKDRCFQAKRNIKWNKTKTTHRFHRYVFICQTERAFIWSSMFFLFFFHCTFLILLCRLEPSQCYMSCFLGGGWHSGGGSKKYVNSRHRNTKTPWLSLLLPFWSFTMHKTKDDVYKSNVIRSLWYARTECACGHLCYTVLLTLIHHANFLRAL